MHQNIETLAYMNAFYLYFLSKVNIGRYLDEIGILKN